MSEPLSLAELAEIESQTQAMLRSGKFLPQFVTRLLAVVVPRLVSELRAQRSELLLLRSDYEETLNIATAGVIELRDAIAARDAQIARLRQIVEGAEVAT
jgi:hypothetical protein